MALASLPATHNNKNDREGKRERESESERALMILCFSRSAVRTQLCDGFSCRAQDDDLNKSCNVVTTFTMSAGLRRHPMATRTAAAPETTMGRSKQVKNAPEKRCARAFYANQIHVVRNLSEAASSPRAPPAKAVRSLACRTLYEHEQP